MIKMEERKKTREAVRKRKEYGVFVYNDDITPFDFVILILKAVFNKTVQEAISIANKAQEEGKAVVIAPITKDVGELLVEACKSAIGENGYDLKVDLEEM